MAGRFQFSIRFVLLATAAVAAGAAAIRTDPSWQSTLAIDCVTVLYATGALIGISQARGKMRSFWIGTSLVLTVAAIHAIDGITRLLTPQYSTGILLFHWVMWKVWCAALVNGVVAVFIHWVCAPRNDAA